MFFVKKSKLLVCLVIVLSIGLLTMGCASKSEPASSDPEKTWTFRLSNGLAVGTYQNSTLFPEFIEQLKTKTNNRVNVDLFPAGQLFGHVETADAVSQGVCEMGFVSLNHFAGYNPILTFNEYAFVVDSFDSWKKNQDAMFKITDEILGKIGVKLLCFAPYSDTYIISNKQINTPEDVKGLRIRGVSDPFFDCIKAWGGVPAAMTPDEAYDAMSKGALDGIMSGIDSAKSRNYFEVADNICGPTASSIWILTINKAVWESLPQDIQQSIQEVCNSMSDKGFSEQAKKDQEAAEFLKTKGMNVKVFTPEEVAVWKKASQPAYDQYIKTCTEAGQGELAQQILDFFLK